MTGNVFVGLGSNLGDSSRILLQAWAMLGEHEQVKPVLLSSPYLSSPVGMTSSHWFVNAVGKLEVALSPESFLDVLLETESLLGRKRNPDHKGYQDRTIDLDLIYFDSLELDHPRLTLPHPRRGERLFVLAPMAEIAPAFIDPETGVAIEQMYREMTARLESEGSRDQEISRTSWPDDKS